MKIVEEARQYPGKALLGHINRSINLMIKATPGYMTSPLEAITMRNGDCKSYSIAKYAAARVAGFSADHVRLVTVHDRRHSFDHMVAAVYQNEGWLKEKRRAGASITTTSRLSCRNCGLRITIRLVALRPDATT
jgi:hypothetical protein